MMKTNIIAIFFSLVSLSLSAQRSVNIADLGAKRGLEFNNAPIIQKAIEDMSSAGGGKVVIPEGNFMTGPLVLKSNVELYLAQDAILWGSAKRLDYSPGKQAVVSAFGQKNIRISGTGTIDGQGRELVENALSLLRAQKIQDPEWLLKRPAEVNRANLLYFKNCTGVKVTGIVLKNAASWVQNYKECTDVTIDSMTVHSNCYWNNDGIDIVDSKHVKITNSYFNAADDAICLKSEIAGGSCEDIRIENCTVRSSASGFKLGTGSVGGFKNITVKGLTVFDTYRSAIALETVDGAFLENVDISEVQGKNTGNAIFIRLGHRNKDARFSSIKNVKIRNVRVEVPSGKPDIGYPMEGPAPKVAAHNLVPSSITGLAGHEAENISLENITITYGGGARKEQAFISIDSLENVPENIAGYPEFTMFAELPSWGLYVRHVKGLAIRNFRISLETPDFRPALVFDDVKGLFLEQVVVPLSNAGAEIIYKNVLNPLEKEMGSAHTKIVK